MNPAGAAPAPEPGFDPGWLALREPADAGARSARLAAAAASAAAARSGGRPLTVHDLGCGTGSMGRWLAPRLPGPQRWVLHDHDPHLLALAAAALPASAADGAPVRAETRAGDLATLDADALDGATLVTASALLDVLTATEIDRLAAACAAPGCPVLLTLTVTGGARLDPVDPLDAALAAAFDAHQRRPHGRRRLLGPDAADAAADAFTRLSRPVQRAASPWRLDATQATDAALVTAWLTGWVAAAVEQDGALAAEAERYLATRREQTRAGRLRVTVPHVDLLVA